MSEARDECHIIGWKNLLGGSTWDLLMNRYECYSGGKTLSLSYTNYIGGSDFINHVKGGKSFDIAIGDREIMQKLAIAGRLTPLPPECVGDLLHNESYPNWLMQWALRHVDRTDATETHFAIPLRWGSSSILVKRDRHRKFHNATDARFLKSLIDEGARAALLNPGDFALSSLSFLASAANPNTPFMLTDEEFCEVGESLERLLNAGSTLVDDLSGFSENILDTEPDVIFCAGDWLLNDFSDKAQGLSWLEDRYIFPDIPDMEFAFFEMLGISSATKNLEASLLVTKILLSREFRQLLEKPTGVYQGNPTTFDSQGYGPGFTRIPVQETLSRARARLLPRNHEYSPKLDDWQRAWREFKLRAQGGGG
ncbi:MAG: hypothetical protein K0U74_13930 [Alphaproteobacteria bacterium]|nr:hypothetical protein [Alphaproteobacteria bacterium]